mgnify:CR=1 FL=1
MSQVNIEFNGMEELQNAMRKAIEKYPGTAEEHLKKVGKTFGGFVKKLYLCNRNSEMRL